MNPESKDKLNQISQELLDQDLIEENRALFWLVATVACEQSEHGALMVDLREPSTEGGYPFSYLTKGEIEFKDDHLDNLLREYDPHREFVIVFSRPDERFNVYLGKAPPIGWWESMVTNTQRLEDKSI
jgi:hypothetical protein